MAEFIAAQIVVSSIIGCDGYCLEKQVIMRIKTKYTRQIKNDMESLWRENLALNVGTGLIDNVPRVGYNFDNNDTVALPDLIIPVGQTRYYSVEFQDGKDPEVFHYRYMEIDRVRLPDLFHFRICDMKKKKKGNDYRLEVGYSELIPDAWEFIDCTNYTGIREGDRLEIWAKIQWVFGQSFVSFSKDRRSPHRHGRLF